MHNDAQRDIELGPYPDVSLREARKQAAHWVVIARSGLDPAVEQEAHRNAAARNLDQFYC